MSDLADKKGLERRPARQKVQPRQKHICSHCGSDELVEVRTTRQLVHVFGDAYGFTTHALSDTDVEELAYQCGDCGRWVTSETLIAEDDRRKLTCSPPELTG